MSLDKTKEVKQVRFFKRKLYMKTDDTERELGLITTKQGGLTRQQKLMAVAANGKWITI